LAPQSEVEDIKQKFNYYVTEQVLEDVRADMRDMAKQE
jgi:hypothetical protein